MGSWVVAQQKLSVSHAFMLFGKVGKQAPSSCLFVGMTSIEKFDRPVADLLDRYCRGDFPGGDGDAS